jgi:hypothetical protein
LWNSNAMLRHLLFSVLFLSASTVFGQSFEMSTLQEMYKGSIGETVKAPIRFKNISEKPIVLIVRKLQEQIGSTQHNFFCPDGNCLEDKITDYIVRLEPGQSLSNLQIGLEGGLVPGHSVVRYMVFNKLNPAHVVEFDVNFTIEEKPEKANIYESNVITVRDVYPNPTVDVAYVNYNLLSDRIKAKIRVHNILGNIVGEYDLSGSENLLRVKTDDLNAGIYFYTLYIDNESVMTRKLIVRK